MTLIVGTLTRDRGYLSKDGILSGAISDQSARLMELQASFRTSEGAEGYPDVKLGSDGTVSARKIQRLPRARTIFACSGSLAFAFAFGYACQRATSIMDLLEIIPSAWPDGDGSPARAIVVAMGWCQAAQEGRGGVIGFEWQSPAGAKPLPVGATFWAPQPDSGGLHADEIRTGLERAARGEDVKQLHQLIGLNVAAASRQGFYNGVIVGGQLQQVLLAERGIAEKPNSIDLDALAAA